MLLEAVAVQDVKNRVFLFIQYLYLDETRPVREKDQRSGLICAKLKPGSH